MALGAHEETFESWGRLTPGLQLIARPNHTRAALELIGRAKAENRQVLGVGLARAYGDSGTNSGGVMIGGRGLDRFIAFDAERGLLRAEAGVSLDEILRLIVPHGWFLPTTPGTRFVTLAGAIANDVHGKNHHKAGSFGRHVQRMGLVRSDLGLVEISPDERPDLFHATIGGLGLTGFMLWAEIALVPIASSVLRQQSVPFGDLDEFFALSEESHEGFEHVSSWIDCTARGANLGRGVLFRANWEDRGELTAHPAGQRVQIPIQAPPGLMNGLTLKALNTGYLAWQRLLAGERQVSYTSAFHPLDAVGHWNRLYGPRGFYQHQSMVPPQNERAALTEILKAISASGTGSFLAVLKTMGPLRSGGLISFEGPGTSLALDFPNKGADTLALLERLDAIVVEALGRIYPAKDARMSPAVFRAGYPRWEALEAERDQLFSSDFWRRITNA